MYVSSGSGNSGTVVVMTGYIWLAIAFCANGAANVLLKMAGKSLDPAEPLLPQALTNLALLAGLATFGLNVIFYLLALRSLPLSVAYPVMVGATFLIVSTASVFFLKEQITVVQYLGFAFIIAGLALAASK